MKSRQDINRCKRVLEAAKLAYANKTKESNSGELLIVFSTKVNLLYLLYSTTQRCCLLHLIKQNCLLKTFLRTLILIISGMSLPVFPSRTNPKLHNISVTPTMVKKVITNLDFSNASGPNFIPVVILKNCEPKLSYILAELF